MDAPTLHSILLHTFSTDADARKAAEEAIKNLHTVRGSIVLLVQLLSSDDVQREIRQAAAISLKNIVHRHWGVLDGGSDDDHDNGRGDGAVDPNPSAFPDADKDEYRSFILEGLFAAQDNSIQALLVESVSIVARQDFPHKWPLLVDNICAAMQSGHATRIINALLALRKLVKIFEYKPSHQRDTLNTIVAMTFPLLRTMLQQLVGNPSDDAGHMVHLTVKVFWSSVQCALPPHMTLEEIGAWLELLKAVLTKSMPDPPVHGGDEDDDGARRNPWWKAKKWTLQVICRFYNVFGNPKHSNSTPELSAFFRGQVAPHLLVAVLETLSLRPSGRYCPDRIVQLSLMYVQEAILSATAYKQLQPHLDFVLFKVIHPLFCLTRSDLDLFQSDPHEYIRRCSDVLGEYLNPVFAAEGLLVELCTKRGKACVVKVLSFYNDLLVPAPTDEAQWIQKEAALHALCALDSFLTLSPPHQAQMESIMLMHVLPAFENPRGYMRLRAVKMLSRNYMTKLVFADPTMSHIIHSLLRCLQDQELPVRIEAAKSFRHVVVYAHSTVVLDTLRPLLPQVLDQFFVIMDDMGFGDEVVLALEQLIDSFCDEVGPYAIQLVVRLTLRFKQCLDKEDDDEDACFTAASCLDTINTILMSIYNQAELFEPLIDALLPTLHLLLSSDAYLDFVESALDIVKSIAYYSAAIHPKVWALFPTLFRGADLWGSEYMHQLVVVLYSLIGRDAAGFVSAVFQVNLANGTTKRIRYIELVYNLVRKLLHKEHVDDEEVWGASAIVECVLHNCDGVEVFIPAVLQLLCFRISRTAVDDPRPLTQLLSALLAALRYNPTLTIAALDKMKVLEPILNALDKNADMRTSVSEQKIYVLGVVALLGRPAADWPVAVQGALKMLVWKAIQSLHRIIARTQQQLAREEAAAHGGSAANLPPADKSLQALIHKGGYDSDEDADLMLHNDDDYAHVLHDLKGGDDLDDEEDKDYYSRIDSIDEVAVFLQAMHGIKDSQPATFEALGLANNQEFFHSCEVFAAELRRRQEVLGRASVPDALEG
ncbi:hypothetical protein, variant 1 [Aphanomyces astaci]|uniref:Importin N-terminal domain-containing protein n=3 Tax=Aphanomyces astaci TaxID=112090 RepID=W4FRB3_APHAT|nr:hypothetical protein, variant 1 [Aphanomyces astaci]ETV70025.1 hypothetical protein, variant 1 [Aphanomyces astaci]|eukprot:XP_009840470.1 hypothetical protein, variant 1 [Aphanomyces astaci]